MGKKNYNKVCYYVSVTLIIQTRYLAPLLLVTLLILFEFMSGKRVGTRELRGALLRTSRSTAG